MLQRKSTYILQNYIHSMCPGFRKAKFLFPLVGNLREKESIIVSKKDELYGKGGNDVIVKIQYFAEGHSFQLKLSRYCNYLWVKFYREIP